MHAKEGVVGDCESGHEGRERDKGGAKKEWTAWEGWEDGSRYRDEKKLAVWSEKEEGRERKETLHTNREEAVRVNEWRRKRVKGCAFIPGHSFFSLIQINPQGRRSGGEEGRGY